jgi:cbb3-type cytochrome oxidase subunit 3
MKANVLPIVAMLGLIAACLFGVFAVRDFVEPRIQAQEQASLIHAQNAEPQTENERMFDRQADMAEKAFAGMVAIAASGDAAQASMVRSFTNTAWAIAVAFVALAVIVFMLKGGGKKSNNQRVTEDDFERESRRL